MPEGSDPLEFRQAPWPAFSLGTKRAPPLAGSIRRTNGPLAGGLRRAAARMVLLLLASALPLAISRGQSSLSTNSQVQMHLERAQAALRANATAAAVKEFREVLALDPRNAEAYANLGVVAFFQHNYPEASKDLRSALTIDPSLVKVEALLGICERILGQSSAQTLLEKSFPRLKDKELRTRVGMELAGLYYQEGDLYRAASIVRILVRLNPDNVDVLYMAQHVYAELSDDTLNKLAIIAPDSARMQEVIAERLVNQGDLKGATEYYKKALKIDPRLPGVHFELGEALWEASPKDPDAQAEAEKEFAMAITVDGDSAAVECRLGDIDILRSDLAGADARFERAYTLNPGNAEAELGLGKVLMMTGKPQRAVKYLRMAAQSDPLNTDVHYRLGMAYAQLKMMDKSRRELRLFQEIREAKARVREVYRQMNERSRTLDERLSGINR